MRGAKEKEKMHSYEASREFMVLDVPGYKMDDTFPVYYFICLWDLIASSLLVIKVSHDL